MTMRTEDFKRKSGERGEVRGKREMKFTKFIMKNYGYHIIKQH